MFKPADEKNYIRLIVVVFSALVVWEIVCVDAFIVLAGKYDEPRLCWVWWIVPVTVVLVGNFENLLAAMMPHVMTKQWQVLTRLWGPVGIWALNGLLCVATWMHFEWVKGLVGVADANTYFGVGGALAFAMLLYNMVWYYKLVFSRVTFQLSPAA